MATMYYLFFGFLFTAVCSDNGGDSRVLSDEFRFAELHFVPVFASFFAENDEVLIHSFEGKKSLDKKEEPCYSLVPNFGSSSGVKANPLGFEDNNNNKSLRQAIIAIASAELGVREATGNNDGPRVEEYLRYTNLSKGYEWCAAFVSWVYGQVGFDVPRSPWSPALFPESRVYWRSGEKVKRLESEKVKADVFGIYGTKVKRINHVGLVKELSNDYLITIEGNSNDRVESRRRHLRTIYAFADWTN